MANPLVVRNRRSSVSQLDRRTQQELVGYTNRIQAHAELAREAMNAISEIFVYSGHQVSLTAIATEAIVNRLVEAGIPTDDYQAYVKLLQQEYLQEMVRATLKATHAINR